MTLAAVLLHAFGPRYDLPISLALYLYAAGGVVVISFVLVAVLAGEKVGPGAIGYPSWPAGLLTALDRARVVRLLGGLVGLAALLLVIGTGFFGNNNPFYNPAEYLVWVYLWAGLVILTGLIGNLWEYLNPFGALHWLVRRAYDPQPRQLPGRLGVWPAIVLYYCFVFLELASGVANQPKVVAALALIYTLFTLAGMLVFGRDAWLGRVEFLTLLLDLVSRFSPVERTEKGLALRPWGVGLLRPYPAGWDRVVFVILTLSSLAFDGLIATQQWQNLSTALEPLWLQFGSIGFALVRGAGILGVTLVFLAVFTVIVRLVIYFGYVRVDVPTTVVTSVTDRARRLARLQRRAQLQLSDRQRAAGDPVDPGTEWLSRDLRARQRSARLVRAGGADRDRPRDRRVHRSPARRRTFPQRQERAAQPVPDAAADGRLHDDLTVDPGPADDARWMNEETNHEQKEIGVADGRGTSRHEGDLQRAEARSLGRGGRGKRRTRENRRDAGTGSRHGQGAYDIIKASAPSLAPRTWYGMPAYAKDGQVVCFFQSGHKFKSRYATLGFQQAANLDEGDIWPTSYALTRLTAAVEEKIRALVKKAAG